MKTATLVYKAPMEGDVDGWHSVRITYDSGHEYKVDWSDRVQREGKSAWFVDMVKFLKENYEDPRTQLSQVSSTDETD